MSDTEARRNEGMDHLQSAGLEMIEAARAFLDVVEEVLVDRDRLDRFSAVVQDAARAAGRLVTDHGGDAASGKDFRESVQHIDLS